MFYNSGDYGPLNDTGGCTRKFYKSQLYGGELIWYQLLESKKFRKLRRKKKKKITTV